MVIAKSYVQKKWFSKNFDCQKNKNATGQSLSVLTFTLQLTFFLTSFLSFLVSYCFILNFGDGEGHLSYQRIRISKKNRQPYSIPGVRAFYSYRKYRMEKLVINLCLVKKGRTCTHTHTNAYPEERGRWNEED